MTSSRAFSIFRALSRSSTTFRARNARFSTSSRLLSSADAASPAAKPIGAFRGGIFGFLFGSLVSGTSAYYYILKEYKLSNEMLAEDIYALQAATQRLSNYITELEGKLDQLQRKK
ncbi:hypothetical protein VTO42DRAFT_7105 [Malbranchea cinnamomea]